MIFVNLYKIEGHLKLKMLIISAVAFLFLPV